MNPTATKIGSVLLVLSGIIGGALFFYGLPQDPITHTIEGVPYYGLYTQKGEASKFNHEVDASLASILEYWNPDTLDFGAFADDLFVELEGLTRDERANYTLDQIGYSLENLANFISRDGLYTARVEGLSLRDAAKYIERDVPLYTYASLTNDAPLAYASPYVLIGIDEVEKRLTLHNYWFGNNLELTFDEFNNLIGAENSTSKSPYLIIETNLNLSTRDLQIPSYERRTALMNNKALMSGYVYLTQAYRYDDCELVLSQYEKISGREDFETQMPPFLKLASHYIAAKCQLKAGDMAVAEALTMKAEALNGNLNAAWGEWQGVELLSNVSGKEGTFPYTYVLLGDISAKKGDSVKAREYYTIAQAIAPNDARINATMNTYVEE